MRYIYFTFTLLLFTSLTASAQTNPYETPRQDLESRISEMDYQLRALTGTVESLQHQLTQMNQQIELFREDYEDRLQHLEQGKLSSAQNTTTPKPTASLPATPEPNTPSTDLGLHNLSQAPVAEPLPPALATNTAEKESAEAQYDQAQSLLKSGAYADAANAFQTFIQKFPEHKLTGNAYYWLGETFYVQKNYERASSLFAEGVKKNPKSHKTPDSLLKLGMSLNAMQRKTDACKVFQELEKRYEKSAPNIVQKTSLEKQKAGCQ